MLPLWLSPCRGRDTWWTASQGLRAAMGAQQPSGRGVTLV